jgi:hypothetical protein
MGYTQVVKESAVDEGGVDGGIYLGGEKFGVPRRKTVRLFA